mmetsp:Transcript_24046/g.42837  ORF Transcript_24046/g.42837 Transcript_24046/m.42837 type:complete len:218 (+) Transcript_24046:262-915(+)
MAEAHQCTPAPAPDNHSGPARFLVLDIDQTLIDDLPAYDDEFGTSAVLPRPPDAVVDPLWSSKGHAIFARPHLVEFLDWAFDTFEASSKLNCIMLNCIMLTFHPYYLPNTLNITKFRRLARWLARPSRYGLVPVRIGPRPLSPSSSWRHTASAFASCGIARVCRPRGPRWSTTTRRASRCQHTERSLCVRFGAAATFRRRDGRGTTRSSWTIPPRTS